MDIKHPDDDNDDDDDDDDNNNNNNNTLDPRYNAGFQGGTASVPAL
jgi:hypothetical protein